MDNGNDNAHIQDHAFAQTHACAHARAHAYAQAHAIFRKIGSINKSKRYYTATYVHSI